MFKRLLSVGVVGITFVSLIVGSTYQNYYANMNQLKYSNYDFASHEVVDLDYEYNFEPIGDGAFDSLVDFLQGLEPYISIMHNVSINVIDMVNGLIELLRGDLSAPSGTFSHYFGYERTQELYNALDIKWWQIFRISVHQSHILYGLLTCEEKQFLYDYYFANKGRLIWNVPLAESIMFGFHRTEKNDSLDYSLIDILIMYYESWQLVCYPPPTE